MMHSTSNEHEVSRKNNGIDRLTRLHDEILVHILSFLPLVDAVRTICIRRFGNLWTLLPKLEFSDCDFFEHKKWPSIITHYKHYDILRFDNFVRNVLILHKRTFLDKFILNIVQTEPRDYQLLFNNIKTWIRFALDRQVKELVLGFEIEDDGFILPRGVFSSPSLVRLYLSGLQIDEPSQAQMGSLESLSLVSVTVTDMLFKKIISGSPSLQQIHLSDVIGLNELRFTAPNIQELHLSNYHGLLDCPNLKILDVVLDCGYKSTHLELIDVSSVREVHIRLHGYIDAFYHNLHVVYDNLDVFYDLLKKFCNVEVFTYTNSHFQSSEFKTQDSLQTRWKSLHIESQLNGDKFLGICYVLKSSPHLEELIVYSDSMNDVHDTLDDVNVLSLELPSCLMQQLKSVTLRGYAVPCHGLLRLAEFLLRSSVTLEKMVILPSKRESASVVDVLKFVKHLSSIPRASTNARVIIGSEHWTIMQDQDPEVLRWQC